MKLMAYAGQYDTVASIKVFTRYPKTMHKSDIKAPTSSMRDDFPMNVLCRPGDNIHT